MANILSLLVCATFLVLAISVAICFTSAFPLLAQWLMVADNEEGQLVANKDEPEEVGNLDQQESQFVFITERQEM